MTWFPCGSGPTEHKEKTDLRDSQAPALTIALASASVLPVALVAIVPAVCPLLRGRQQLSGLFLVLGDNGLRFLLLKLPICHLIHVVAFLRQREVGWKDKKSLWA